MKPCIINSDHRPVQKKTVRNKTDIYICPDCGCLMADISFNKDQYEDTAYYTMSRKTKDSIENKWGLRWRHILKLIIKITGRTHSSPLTLLDVGAGNGYFVHLASSEFGIDSKGLGMSEEENRFAKEITGVELIHGEVTNHDIIYDVVTCFNVIEHVEDPEYFLSALVDRVKINGVLLLSTPNTTCLRSRIKGIHKWERIDPPHHIHLFPKNALREFMSKHNLAEMRYETLSTYISFIDSKRLFIRRIIFMLLKLFNLGSDHLFVMRKID